MNPIISTAATSGEKNYSTITSIEQAAHYIGDSKAVAFDFETAPDEDYRIDSKAALDPAKSHICTMSLSTGPYSAVMLPVHHLCGQNVPAEDFREFLANFTQDRTITKIAHNLAFESQFCYKEGLVIQTPVYDTICGAQMTLKAHHDFRNLSDSGLKTLAATVLHEPLPDFMSVTGGHFFDELDPLDPETIRYSCADADFAFRLWLRMNEWFDKYLPNHRRIVEDLESPTAVYVGMMHYNGIPMNLNAMTSAKMNTEREIARLFQEISDITGGVNIGANCSTKAFRDYLYVTAGLPVVKRTEKLVPATDDETMLLLKDWCRANRPELSILFDKVLEYRKWGKINSTYLTGYLKYVNNATKRIHPDFMQLATDTGRFACRNPNFQNCPAKGEDPIGIRGFITAPEGWQVMEADYSQAEIRLCAYLSQDKTLLDAYEQGADVHAITTSAIFGIPLEEAMDHSNPQYKHRRTVAKRTMFGIMYGIGGSGLSRNLYTNAGITLSREDCDQYIAGILDKYTGMAAWQKRMKAEARSLGYVETATGRRRYLPGIRSRNRNEINSAERMAINTPVQGLGADCLKHALSLLTVELADKPYIRPIFTVHDSLVFLVRSDKVEEASELIRRCMETPLDLPNFRPLLVEVSSGQTYADMT